MSIATEISRIQSNRNTIRNKLIDFGLAESTANLDALAAATWRGATCTPWRTPAPLWRRAAAFRRRMTPIPA